MIWCAVCSRRQGRRRAGRCWWRGIGGDEGSAGGTVLWPDSGGFAGIIANLRGHGLGVSGRGLCGVVLLRTPTRDSGRDVAGRTDAGVGGGHGVDVGLSRPEPGVAKAGAAHELGPTLRELGSGTTVHSDGGQLRVVEIGFDDHRVSLRLRQRYAAGAIALVREHALLEPYVPRSLLRPGIRERLDVYRWENLSSFFRWFFPGVIEVGSACANALRRRGKTAPGLVLIPVGMEGAAGTGGSQAGHGI